MNWEADAASLRRIFNEAVDTYPSAAKFLSKEGEAHFRTWWGQLYAAVRDHHSGLRLLAEMQTLRDRIKELENQ